MSENILFSSNDLNIFSNNRRFFYSSKTVARIGYLWGRPFFRFVCPFLLLISLLFSFLNTNPEQSPGSWGGGVGSGIVWRPRPGFVLFPMALGEGMGEPLLFVRVGRTAAVIYTALLRVQSLITLTDAVSVVIFFNVTTK